jgi:hypothetical protein
VKKLFRFFPCISIIRHIRNVILSKMAEDEDSGNDIPLQKQVIQAQIGKTMAKGQTWYYYVFILLHIYVRCVVFVMVQCLYFVENQH